MAHVGFTTAQARAVVDVDIAGVQNKPLYALLNYGAIDVAAMPVQATYEADLAYILDAIHIAWPSCRVGVARVWRRTYGTECNTLAGYISNVVTPRNAWAFLGPDERVFLENGDNGVTYTTDGTHPNHAGYVLTAAAWKTAMGL